MDSACGNAALPALGFPIRESTDHRLFSAYPWLIAAVHALHRLLVPRHPPCALNILTVISIGVIRRPRKAGRATPQIPAVAQGDDGCPVIPVIVGNCAVFKVRGRRDPWLGARSLKTQQHEAHELAPASTRLLRPLVGTRFQVLFHSPSGVLFTFPSRY